MYAGNSGDPLSTHCALSTLRCRRLHHGPAIPEEGPRSSLTGALQHCPQLSGLHPSRKELATAMKLNTAWVSRMQACICLLLAAEMNLVLGQLSARSQRTTKHEPLINRSLPRSSTNANMSDTRECSLIAVSGMLPQMWLVVAQQDIISLDAHTRGSTPTIGKLQRRYTPLQRESQSLHCCCLRTTTGDCTICLSIRTYWGMLTQPSAHRSVSQCFQSLYPAVVMAFSMYCCKTHRAVATLVGWLQQRLAAARQWLPSASGSATAQLSPEAIVHVVPCPCSLLPCLVPGPSKPTGCTSVTCRRISPSPQHILCLSLSAAAAHP